MNKSILILLVVVLISTFCCSCYFITSSDTKSSDISSSDPHISDVIVDDSFECVYSVPSSDFKIYRDPVTDVLYLWRKVGYAGGLSVMLDPETGLPLTYSRYINLRKE